MALSGAHPRVASGISIFEWSLEFKQIGACDYACHVVFYWMSCDVCFKDP